MSDIHGRPLPSARARTLLTLFRNALAVIISTITIMIVLSEIGVNIAPLLAGAGALGLAISFGSQTLVKDIITGIFIQFENGMNTGDLVTIGPLTGTVERMSIRSVGVRQDTGAYHIIPWSSITTFANFVRGIGSVVANYDVDRHEDADKAKQALRDAVEELMQMEDIRGPVIGEPSFAGIVGLTNTAFTLRVSFTTQPLKQWTVRFALDSMVKNTLIWQTCGCRCRRIRCCLHRHQCHLRRSRHCSRVAGWRASPDPACGTPYLRRLLSSINDRAIKRLCFWPCAISFSPLSPRLLR